MVRILEGGGGFAGAVARHGGLIQGIAKTLASGPVVHDIAKWGVDTAKRKAAQRDLGRRKYNTVYGNLAQEIVKDMGRYVPKGVRMEAKVEQVIDHQGVNITHFYNLDKLSKDLTDRIANIR